MNNTGGMRLNAILLACNAVHGSCCHRYLDVMERNLNSTAPGWAHLRCAAIYCRLRICWSAPGRRTTNNRPLCVGAAPVLGLRTLRAVPAPVRSVRQITIASLPIGLHRSRRTCVYRHSIGSTRVHRTALFHFCIPFSYSACDFLLCVISCFRVFTISFACRLEITCRCVGLRSSLRFCSVHQFSFSLFARYCCKLRADSRSRQESEWYTPYLRAEQHSAPAPGQCCRLLLVFLGRRR